MAIDFTDPKIERLFDEAGDIMGMALNSCTCAADISQEFLNLNRSAFNSYFQSIDVDMPPAAAYIVQGYFRQQVNTYSKQCNEELLDIYREMYTRVSAFIIGSRIKAVRKAKGMSQTALANSLRKTLRTIQKYENGEVDLSLSQIDYIADTLGVDASTLLGYDEKPLKVRSLADVLAFVHDLARKEEIRFNINCKLPFGVSIEFDAQEEIAEHNADLCLMLQEYHLHRVMIPYTQIPINSLDKWVQEEMPRLSASTLIDRDPNELYARKKPNPERREDNNGQTQTTTVPERADNSSDD